MRSEGSAQRRAGRVAGSTLVRLAARAGLAGNGLLHLVVAWLAVRVATGATERADQVGALAAIAEEPGGRLLLWAVAFGFAATVVRLLRQAMWGRRAVQERLTAAGEAVLFTGLAVLAVRAAAGVAAGAGGSAVTATLLRLPGGRAAVVATGAVVLVGGLVQAARGIKLEFVDELNLRRAGPFTRELVKRSGQFGKLAKGVAVAIIGLLVVLAALRYQPAKAEGLDAALKAIAAQPYGQAALLAVAVGLASNGVFCLFEALYRRV